jgi:V/A-type H+-transporting ATPase subunit F
MKLVVIGDPEFNVGFGLAGIASERMFDIKSDDEIIESVRKALDDKEVGIVVIKYDYLKKLPPALRREIDERVQPTFVAVGGTGGVEEIREKIRKAIGVDLWK